MNNLNCTSIYFFLFALVILSSCEKEVKIKLKPGSEKVVVDGRIETGQIPFVIFTRSIDFFSKIDLNTLEDAFLHDAVMTISDGQKTITLREYEFLNNGIRFFIYSADTANGQSFQFKGEFGKTYDLKIQYNGQVYQSQTTIPFVKNVDSMWASPPDFPSNDYPDLRSVFAQYTDPDTLGNRIRYFVSRNNQEFLPPFFSTYDDALINGTTVPVRIYPGFNKADSIVRETFGYFSKGDTVVLKWSSIDQKVFDFWQTLEFSATATGNPFAAPVEVSTNISNGALGVWAGYGNSFDTLIISQ